VVVSEVVVMCGGGRGRAVPNAQCAAGLSGAGRTYRRVVVTHRIARLLSRMFETSLKQIGCASAPQL